MKKNIKIFLAHTKEVEGDVKDIKRIIYDKYTKSEDYKVIIEDWSNTDKGLSPRKFQDELNEIISTCEILYIFFKNRIGKYTKEEFEYGFRRFKDNQKPYKISIFSEKYQMDGDAEQIEENNHQEVKKFKEKVKEINGNQYLHTYTDINDVENQLIKQLEKDIENVIKIQEKNKTNPRLSLIKFEGKCREDIIPIAMNILKHINTYIKENICSPCTSGQYSQVEKELLKIYEDETLNLSIEYLLFESCINFLYKEDKYGNKIEYIQLKGEGHKVLRLRNS